ncbi:AMIN domain-containing protein [Sulfuricurvum sp.]|uniref:AMIN domain-containing protein n=1 Tax=Sulfuricurvum sp. TaxID=2025608 RepID=UPI002D6946D7|nr:AMIN domain-containing protein [Sulfuricurvum sp.]HZF71225.1 AMIN domain-containing protein [Sulfuricurvum sp.]
MKRSLYLSLILLAPLIARDNPFFAADETKKEKITSNCPDNKPQLQSVNYTLPDQARILKEVTFTIQNLDGSIETRKIEVDQSIDWHKSLTISQTRNGANPRATADGSGSADFGFIRFDSKGKRLSVKTSDTLMRHFVLSNPNRIVLDFKNSSVFKITQKDLGASPYVNVVVGNHGKFMRATITLDGRYSYSLSKTGEFISIICK